MNQVIEGLGKHDLRGLSRPWHAASRIQWICGSRLDPLRCYAQQLSYYGVSPDDDAGRRARNEGSSWCGYVRLARPGLDVIEEAGDV